jgi:hypothetical protein
MKMTGTTASKEMTPNRHFLIFLKLIRSWLQIQSFRSSHLLKTKCTIPFIHHNSQFVILVSHHSSFTVPINFSIRQVQRILFSFGAYHPFSVLVWFWLRSWILPEDDDALKICLQFPALTLTKSPPKGGSKSSIGSGARKRESVSR